MFRICFVQGVSSLGVLNDVQLPFCARCVLCFWFSFLFFCEVYLFFASIWYWVVMVVFYGG